MARKVSSKKNAALGSAGPATGNTSTANATRALDHFTSGAAEGMAQRRTSAAAATPVLGKVPAKKIKAKIVKQPED